MIYAGRILMIVSVLAMAAVYFMNWSAAKRFDARTENLDKIRRVQRQTTGTEYSGNNFYLQPDPDRKAFWANAWNFALALGVTGVAVGGLLHSRFRRKTISARDANADKSNGSS